ncbi:MAG TPA: secretin N-terminal domain-containing protein [Thermoanaerobaculia bacterium]|jgi:general secretion pathway protein D
MNRLKAITAAVLISLVTLSCASYSAYQKARAAETDKNWDVAVTQYEKALEIDPNNREYKVALDRARREASRAHFEKGKTLRAAANEATGNDQLRLAQLAMSELQLTVRLDSSNQYAAVELSKVVGLINDIQRAAAEQTSVDEVKRRARSSITKAQPPQLNPTSNEPISLTFARETPVKDIYRALGNAFGINILFDQAVKDDRISIELRDVTAQQALERVMQAANHFYKVLDERTIIVVPDNPQARRDYEDLVIRTFYLSNGDAEQVTNVVRTMIEARNVFPLKALNAITIRDTADKVRIAEKIIEANDKAKAEVVVAVELVQLDLSRIRDVGVAITGVSGGTVTPLTLDSNPSSPNYGKPIVIDNKVVPFTGGTLSDIANSLGDVNALRNGLSFSVPAATYSLLKTLGNSELLANPELRISEGEKATLHIGQRIPVPVTTVAGVNPGTTTNPNNLYTPYTSFQYQDVGIKVAMEPRVHHNREVTLKLTVEVSNQGNPVTFAGQSQPTFATRTIESTIRLKDGETNFLAGLIQSNKVKGVEKTPILGEIPIIGRLFSKERNEETRTDLVLTMTPHIIRIPDITEEDVAPMWVGTGNNLTFRGVSPRIESQIGADPFVPRGASGRPLQLSTDGEPGNYIQENDQDAGAPDEDEPAPPPPTQGTAPNDPFRRQPPPPTQNPVPPTPQASKSTPASDATGRIAAMSVAAANEPDTAALRLAPRIGPQPATISLGPGETKLWSVIGMDLDGLTANELLLHYDPRSMDVTDVAAGAAIDFDPNLPPVIAVDRNAGTIRVTSAKKGEPLRFVGGGQVLTIRVHGGLAGETFLVLENPDFRARGGQSIVAAVAGGRARVQ